MQLQQLPKTPTKKQDKPAKKVQTTSIKTVDNQTKIAVKLVKGERKIHPCTLCKFTAQHPKDLIRHMRCHTGIGHKNVTFLLHKLIHQFFANFSSRTRYELYKHTKV